MMDKHSDNQVTDSHQTTIANTSGAAEAKGRWQLTAFAASLMLGALLVILLSHRSGFDFEDAATAGADTHNYFASVNGVSIHCQDARDLETCLSGYDVRGQIADTPTVVWLGNSQLHALNQFVSGEANAPLLLHNQLVDSGRYLLTFSQPNANLQEHLVLLAYLTNRLPVQSVLLGLVYDDTRESGLRPEIAQLLADSDTRRLLSASNIGTRLLTRYADEYENKTDTLLLDEAHAGLQHVQLSLQERSENWLNLQLSAVSDLWTKRADMRATLFFSLYSLRNRVFGISATSKRRRIPANYADNMAALNALLQMVADAGITAHVYNAPLRQDIEMPYRPNEYATYKQETVRSAAEAGADYRNLETLIEPRHWGYTGLSDLAGRTRQQVDFMHFKATGHQVFADTLADWLSDQ